MVAIVLTALAFAFAHSQNAEFSLPQIPFYLGVGATFGTLAYLTNSILPGMALHVGAVVLQGIGELAQGVESSQASSGPPRIIWETGADASFWILCGAMLILGAATVWAYTALAAVARKTPDLP